MKEWVLIQDEMEKCVDPVRTLGIDPPVLTINEHPEDALQKRLV